MYTIYNANVLLRMTTTYGVILSSKYLKIGSTAEAFYTFPLQEIRYNYQLQKSYVKKSNQIYHRKIT